MDMQDKYDDARMNNNENVITHFIRRKPEDGEKKYILGWKL
jgi:hypothetical protein